MSQKQKAIIDFSDYQEDELEPTVNIIISSLTTNALVFPALPVVVLTLTNQLGAYTLILGKPEYHGKAADLSAARLILEASLSDNGNYVNQVAKGDPIKLAKSGYPLTKLRQPIGPLPKTIIKVRSTDNGGEFHYEIDGVNNADGFLICFTKVTNIETNPHKWQWQWCPKTRGLISGLETSTRYKLVSVAVGTDPLLTFSDPIERTTQ